MCWKDNLSNLSAFSIHCCRVVWTFPSFRFTFMNASAEMWGCQNISRELIKRMLANKGEKSRGTFAFSPTEQTIVPRLRGFGAPTVTCQKPISTYFRVKNEDFALSVCVIEFLRTSCLAVLWATRTCKICAFLYHLGSPSDLALFRNSNFRENLSDQMYYRKIK